MSHYGMEPTTNNTGIAHENGDVEQAHHRFKEVLDQALRVRGSRDFADRASYERFVAELVKQRNQTWHLPASKRSSLPSARCRWHRFRLAASYGSVSRASRPFGCSVIPIQCLPG